jgi:diguanylate cyclase (GGDEF)-like protein
MISVSRRAKNRFIIGCIFLAVIGNAALEIWWDYQETYQRQTTTVRDVSRVVEAQIHNSVLQGETILGFLGEMIQADHGLGLINEKTRWEKLHSLCAALSGCRSIAVVNTAGKIIALSDVQNPHPIDASDREYFRVAKSSNKLFIGPAVVARTPGNPILFSIARPVSDSSGKLLAVVSVGMDTAHLTDFYGLLGFAVNPTVTIFKTNGDLVARNPDMVKYVGKNFSSGPLFQEQLPKAPSGTYLSHSVLDGKVRIASYQVIKELDLVVYAGIDLGTALRDWRSRAWRTGIASAISLGFILLALYWGYRSLERSRNLKAKNQELDRISNLDALTGIANRRYFDTSLNGIWSSHREENKPLSLLMIDIDYFKQFNDQYGHQAGDKCLRIVATALQAALLRNVDVVARYGGEEFVAILDVDQSGAAAVADRMRVAVEALAIPNAGSGVASVVTISVGVAATPSSGARTIAELIGAADSALYVAKHNGRNRVAVYSADSAPGSRPAKEKQLLSR